jgi:protein-tyrosine phosphatase
MIDLHCHILPGLDDGPESLDESLAMCRAAAADGVRCIVATPHRKPGTYEISSSRVMEAIHDLTDAVRGIGLKLRILPGAEVTVSPEMISQIAVGGELTLNHGCYFLAEFSPLTVPAGWDSFLVSFMDKGLVPIIAHPERNAWFVQHPEALSSAVHRGIKLQLTAMSLSGAFGVEARDFSIELLRQNLVHVLASDGHSAAFRPPKLSDACRLAADLLGKERAEALVQANPKAIIESRPLVELEPVSCAPPIQKRKKSWFQKLKGLGFAGSA